MIIRIIPTIVKSKGKTCSGSATEYGRRHEGAHAGLVDGSENESARKHHVLAHNNVVNLLEFFNSI